MRCLSLLLLIFYSQLSAQPPAAIPRSIKSLVEIFSPAKQTAQNITNGLSNTTRSAISATSYLNNSSISTFSTNSLWYSKKSESSPDVLNQYYTIWDDKIGENNRKRFGTYSPSMESKKLYKENRKALKILSDQFDVNVTVQNQTNLSELGSPRYKESRNWKEFEILEDIVTLQKINGLAAENFSNFSDRNVRLITKEGIVLLNEILAQIKSNIYLYESIIATTGKPSVLKNTELFTDLQEFKNYYFKATEKKEFLSNLILLHQPQLSKKNRSHQVQPKTSVDLKGRSFTNVLNAITEEIKREIRGMSSIEMSLIKLGFIEFDFTKIVINSEIDLQNEFRYLRDRLDTGIADFKDAYNIDPNEKLTYETIEAKVNQETDALFSMLRASIHNGEVMSKLELLEFYRKAKKSSSGTLEFFDHGLRESIYSDKNAEVYYVKGADGIETFQKETIEIKVEGKETVFKEVIKLFANTNLYTEIEPELFSKVEAVRKNLDKTIEKENIHILFFTKFKNKEETKGDDTIDSLKRMFKKEHITFIYNKNDKRVRRRLNRAYQRNKKKTIFNISHIDNGALMSTENTNYELPIDELNTFSEKYKVNDYLAGCNGAYYENRGTTDLINTLGFATAIAQGIKQSTSHGAFMRTISTNEAIKGQEGEVKLLMDEATFSNEKGTSAAVYKNENQLWTYLSRLFLQKN